ncbi:MAG: AEC family transporter, partial [Candidatus Alcyoniella australis]|nr:AEC family transporter [Candidatus Alcyoniella australis]
LVAGIFGGMIVLQVLIYLWTIQALGRPEMRGGVLSAAFGNTGAINLPLSYLAFGDEGLRVAVLVMVVTAVLHYSLGIYSIAGRRAGLELVRSPLLYAAIAGSLAGLYQWQAPQWIGVTIQTLGQATIPLLLIMLGFQLSATPFTMFGKGALIALGRSLGGVAIVWPLVVLLRLDGPLAAVLVISSSMPPAIVNFMLARRYNAAPELNAGAIMVGTGLALVISSLLLIHFAV